MPESNRPQKIDLQVMRNDGELVLTLGGRLDIEGTAILWPEAVSLLTREKPTKVTLDLSRVSYCDGAGISLLLEIKRHMLPRKGEVCVQGLQPEFRRLLDQFVPANFQEIVSERPRPGSLATETGRAAVRTWTALGNLIAFVGELTVALLKTARRPGQVRWRDVWLIFEKAGVDALPIVALISFLVGLIMAFQAAIPMKQFGTEIYVANIIGLAILRELGPLMTSLLLAGRSGSAFAAELGTMKINEEIDALTTLGLDPVPFLVIPRVLAALFVTPLLTLFANLLGLFGGSVVLLSLGYPMTAYIRQLQTAVGWTDLNSGLFKSLVFGLIVATIGCLNGLRTEFGPSAVGNAATRAVVSAIILIVVTDGIFSVLFYYLGI
ncbi:MAG: MlaE family lipid ABC transporter permease subunit [Syntrophotaleaceae bacterium]